MSCLLKKNKGWWWGSSIGEICRGTTKWRLLWVKHVKNTCTEQTKCCSDSGILCAAQLSMMGNSVYVECSPSALSDPTDQLHINVDLNPHVLPDCSDGTSAVSKAWLRSKWECSQNIKCIDTQHYTTNSLIALFTVSQHWRLLFCWEFSSSAADRWRTAATVSL